MPRVPVPFVLSGLLAGILPPATTAQESLDPERNAMYARYMAIPTLVKGGLVLTGAPAGAQGAGEGGDSLKRLALSILYMTYCTS